jgi:hypothetical protein
MSAVEQELIEKISYLNSDQQRQVLEFVESLESFKRYSARELMKLPPEERERLVQAAFALAAEEDFEVFEAYSQEALDDSSA